LRLIVDSAVQIDLTKEMDKIASQPDFLRRTIDSYADVSTEHIADSELDKIVKSCPSLFTYVETSKAYFVSAAAAHIMRMRSGNFTIKKTNPSDFSDMMHCFYAPYFDVFRCDVRFGALLKKHRPIRTRVVDRIGNLLQALLPETIHKTG
jgi:hypothetical protein